MIRSGRGKRTEGRMNSGLTFINPSLGGEILLSQDDVTGDVYQHGLDSIKLPYFINTS